MLGSDYYLVQFLLFNYGLLLNKDQEIKVFHLCFNSKPIPQSTIKHVYVLKPLVRPHVRHARLGLYIAVSLKVTTTRIWSFGCGFACAIAMGCAGFRLLFGLIIAL